MFSQTLSKSLCQLGTCEYREVGENRLQLCSRSLQRQRISATHILVGDPGCDIEHDDTAIASNVVAISQTSELLLPCSVPYAEDDLAKVGVELERVDFDTEGG